MNSSFRRLGVLIALTVIIVLCLTGCGDKIPNESHEVFSVPDRFVRISEQGSSLGQEYFIFVDRETRVMYWMISGSNDYNGLSPLLNSDGTPLLYKGAL